MDKANGQSKTPQNVESKLDDQQVHGAEEKQLKTVMGKPLDTIVPRKRPAVNYGLSGAGNKENANVKAKNQLTTRTPQVGLLGTARKSQSTNVQGKSAPVGIKRTQSDQSIARAREQTSAKEVATPIKKIASVQNVSTVSSGNRQSRVQSSANHVYADLLANFEKEKKLQERRISELIQLAETRKTEIEKLKFEKKNLKHKIPGKDVTEAMDGILAENQVLKEKLKSLGVNIEVDTSKLLSTDVTKEDSVTMATSSNVSITAKSSSSVHSKPDGSEADDHTADSEMTQSVGDATCVTPDHPSSVSVDLNSCDRLSVKSANDALSEISVSCLQDRIQKMEESHYSTNEELQATLQELSDLQSTVNQLTSENEQLVDEKSFLMESLCTQTEKLENVRLQIDHLKALFLSKENVSSPIVAREDRHLAELLRLTMHERDDILSRQMDIVNTIQMYEQENKDLQDAVASLQNQIQKLLETRQDERISERHYLEGQITELRAREAQLVEETGRLQTLLDVERQTVAKYEVERTNNGEKDDLLQLLNGTRAEKETFEQKLAESHAQLAAKGAEIARLKEQLSFAEEEVRACQSSELSRVGDLEFAMRKFEREKQESEQLLQAMKLNVKTMEQELRNNIKEKQEMADVIARLNADIHKLQQTLTEAEVEGHDAKRRHSEERDDWAQFQADLQTAVVVANNLRIESQEDAERLLAENQYLRDRLTAVEMEAEHIVEEHKNKANQLQNQQHMAAASALPEAINMLNKSDIRGRVLSTVDRELALRKGRRMTDIPGSMSSLSVKNLIASLEGQVKGMRAGDVTTPPLAGTGLGTSPLVGSLVQRTSRQSSVESNSSKASSGDTASNSDALKSGCDLAGNRTPVALQDVTNASKEPPTKVPSTTGGDDPKVKANMPADAILSSLIGGGVKPLSPYADNAQSDAASKVLPRASLLGSKKSAASSSLDGDSSKSPTAYGVKNDPLTNLAKQMGGSKRNALLRWCQQRTARYPGIDITNFSSSWNDGLAFCALLHTYLPDKVPFKELDSQNKMKNFSVAFKASESVNIPNSLNVNDLLATERPDWQGIMAYVINIYKHFEVDPQEQL